MKIKLLSKYSIGNGTKEEIDDFNKFYDLEEARLNHEEKMQIDWAITDSMEKMFE